MKIDAVIVLCWKGDFRLARICLASVRYFYPRIPLFLMKDETRGAFDTTEVESALEVRTGGLAGRHGPGMGKLELLFRPELGRFLYLDADEIMAGPVLDSLATLRADLVVVPDGPNRVSPDIDRLYYDRRLLRELDPDYRLPRFHFNSGQFVARGGAISRDDFRDLVAWGQPSTVRHRHIFRLHEQGLLNYVAHRLAAARRLSLEYAEFMHLARTEYFRTVPLAEVAARRAQPLLFHWAGASRGFLSAMRRADLLGFFEDHYYSLVPRGGAIRLGRRARALPEDSWRQIRGLAGRWKRALLRPRAPAGPAPLGGRDSGL
jgi:hypothetical protein